MSAPGQPAPHGDDERRAREETEHHMEQLVGRLLQVGVMLAAAVVLVGGVWLLSRYGGVHADFRVFHVASPELRSIGGIVQEALQGHSRAVVQLGLVLLIATPVARVALTLVAFVLQRDRLYVAITALVLALLLYGLLWGHG